MIWLFICLVRSSRLWRTKVYRWRTGATNEILRSTNDGPRSVDEVFLILLLNGAFSFSTLFIIIVIFPPYFFTISTPPWLLLEQLQAHNPSLNDDLRSLHPRIAKKRLWHKLSLKGIVYRKLPCPLLSIPTILHQHRLLSNTYWLI